MSEDSSENEKFLKEAAEAEREIIKEIRGEASSAKGCFTQYSFQTLAFSTGILSFILGALQKFPMAMFAGVPAVILLMIMCRIGIYKYMTANRGYGYQLYFEKFRGFLDKENVKNNNYCPEEKEAWELIIKTKSWEEIFRAWRIIHPTIFRKLYKSPANRVNKNPWIIFCEFIDPTMYQLWQTQHDIVSGYRKKSVDERKLIDQPGQSEEYPWFMVKDVAQMRLESQMRNPGIKIIGYYAGTYLHNMLLMLFVLQYLFMLPFFIYIIENYHNIKLNFWTQNFLSSLSKDNWFLDFTLIFSILWLTFIVCRHIRTFRRKEIIENELFSIHSCAIAWQIVIIANYRSFKEAKKQCADREIEKKDITYSYYFDKFYIEELIQQAQDIAKNVFTLNKWYTPDEKTSEKAT
jgi:hypothetical protein